MSHASGGTMRRGGFTLIEMLVAVTLVTLMMTLFASVFQVATGLMGKQKGIAENDQRARLLVTLLRNDLNKRTMKEVAPWKADEVNTPDAGLVDLGNRAGYFYISENSTTDDTDDVLAFVVNLNSSDDIFHGRAHALADAGGNTTSINQPEYDDGRIDANEAGSSSYAEVVYFLRNGILYRRVMLIRDKQTDGTPKDSAGPTALVTTPYEAAGATRNLWSDFDYSIHYDSATSKPQFHGSSVLDNSGPGLAGNDPRLGIPNCRFGFNHATGLPREHIGNTFIGRYLHQETSSPSFGYPGRITAGSPNPMDPATTRTINANGIVTEYADGTRIAEDMLLSNVHAFDIKVWDPAASTGPDGAPGKKGVDDDNDDADNNTATSADNSNAELGWPGTDDGAFVDVGHTGATGFYRAGANANANYVNALPGGGTGFIFDTWHPKTDVPTAGGLTEDPPPFRPTPIGATTWKYRRNPLRAIQIKIRFYDLTSTQLREVSFVQSLDF